MDAALIVITLLSVALTGALLVYASKLQREQREREEARVTALAREIRVDAPPAAAVPLFRERETHGFGAHVAGCEAEPAVSTGPASGAEATGDPEGAGLFAVNMVPAHRARSLAIPTIGALVVGLVVGGAYLASTRMGAPPAAVVGTMAPGALELVSLEQSRNGNALTVRGVVRNPGGAAIRRGVAAVVFVFDRAGGFVTSARAAIDYQALEGGDESPFTVTVPDASTAGRYRVSFRTGRDVLPHVDRRPQPAAVAGSR